MHADIQSPPPPKKNSGRPQPPGEEVFYRTVKTVLRSEESICHANIRKIPADSPRRRILILFSGGYKERKKGMAGRKTPP
jgi:hypothetical protein